MRDLLLKRWLKRMAIAIGAILVFVVAPAAFILYPTFKSYPQLDLPPVTSQAEKNLQDVAFLRRLPEVERSFKDETRARFAGAVDRLKGRAAQLDRPAFAMEAARAVALADNGHTNIVGLAAGHGFNVLPVRFGWFSDGLFVVAAHDKQRHLLGAQVLGLNGQPPEQVVQALRTYVGGPPTLARELSPNLLASPELLYAAGLVDRPGEAELHLRLRDDSEGIHTLAAAPGTDDLLTRNFWPKRYLSPVPMPSDSISWAHVLDHAPLSASLARPDQNVWHDYLNEGRVLYVQINRLRDQDGESLHGRLADILAEAKARQVRHAVVDLRFDPGGDYTLSADFTQQLPQIVPGKIFVLVSGTTFSAAISTAARLKYYAGTRGFLVGELMGDRTRFWGEGGTATMPNSKLTIRYTTAFHDWESGCRLTQVRTCFFLNYFYGTPSGALTPDIPVAQTSTSYAVGKDVVLEKALELAEPGS